MHYGAYQEPNSNKKTNHARLDFARIYEVLSRFLNGISGDIGLFEKVIKIKGLRAVTDNIYPQIA